MGVAQAPEPDGFRGLVGTLSAEGFNLRVEVVDHRPGPRRPTAGNFPAGAGPAWSHELLMRALEVGTTSESTLESRSTGEITTLPTQLELTLESPTWRGRFEVVMRAEPRAGVLCFAGRATPISSEALSAPIRAMDIQAPELQVLRDALDRALWVDHSQGWEALAVWLSNDRNRDQDQELPGREVLHAMLGVWLQGTRPSPGLRSDDLVDDFVAAKASLSAHLPRAAELRRHGLGQSPWVLAAEWFGPFVVRLLIGGGQGQGPYSEHAFANVLTGLGPCGLLLSEARCLRVRPGLELEGRPLEMIALPNFDLRGVDGRGARLSRASLRKTWLDGVDLSGADLRGADLRRTMFGDAVLDRADLRGARLEGADLSGARLRGADLRGARLNRVELQGARLDDADLRGADLRGAAISGSQLRSAVVEGDWWDSQLD